MNSIIEVSPNIIAIIGSDNLSDFRLNQLRQSIPSHEHQDIQCHEIYFCQLKEGSSNLSESCIVKLTNLLNSNQAQSNLAESFFFITPRIGTISPWSSKATDILNNSGLTNIKRVERGMCYYFNRSIESDICQFRTPNEHWNDLHLQYQPTMTLYDHCMSI